MCFYNRKAPQIRLFQKDELGNFENDDIIKSFNDLTAKNAPPGYLCYYLLQTFLMKKWFSFGLKIL